MLRVGPASQRPPRADEVAVDVGAVAGDDVAKVLLVSEREGGEVQERVAPGRGLHRGSAGDPYHRSPVRVVRMARQPEDISGGQRPEWAEAYITRTNVSSFAATRSVSRRAKTPSGVRQRREAVPICEIGLMST